jgi:hypothetical protein
MLLFLHDSFFDPEDEGNMFLWNTDWLSTDYMVLYPRIQNSSLTTAWEPQILQIALFYYVRRGRILCSTMLGGARGYRNKDVPLTYTPNQN